MVPLKTMESASPCHMCGRCAGFRNAIELRPRWPGSEVIEISGRSATKWDSLLIIVGMLGVATGAFLWSASPWLIMAKQWIAVELVQRGILWPLQQSLPWFVLTNNQGGNDVLSVLDGGLLLGFIALTTFVMGLAVAAPLGLATRLLGSGWIWQRFHHLAHGLLPVAACGIILGLSAQTVTLLRQDHILLPWIAEARFAGLALAAGWSIWLIWRIAGQYATGKDRILSTGFGAVTALAGALPWVLLFWIW